MTSNRDTTRILDRTWFERHPVRVAFDLVASGSILRSERDGAVVEGRIVEVEAYAGPTDLASHAARMKAARVLLSGLPGSLYVYRSYGIHTMLNIVAHEPAKTGGILIRGIDPLAGLEAMAERRGPKARTLATGPGVLTQAFAVRLDDVGRDLLTDETFSLRCDAAADWVQPPHEVAVSPRIGISRGLSADWRLFVPGAVGVSVHSRGRVVTASSLNALIPPDGTIVE
ncbi:MAG: DNA-3-methyladenine glycosylase [Thermomicrobiales bacterium]